MSSSARRGSPPERHRPRSPSSRLRGSRPSRTGSTALRFRIASVPTTSYWLAEPYEPLPRVALAGEPDVAVVGGGITVCSCALALAEAGLRVRLYDAREIAGGASGRNGGFALRGAAAPYPVIVESLGREQAAELWRWTERALDDLAELAGDAFRRTGSLRLAADEEERVELEQEYEALRADGFAVEWRGELAPPLDGRFPAALRHPDGVLQPARLVRRLARRAGRRGDLRAHACGERRGDRGRSGGRRHRRLSQRSPWSARGADRSHARAGDRH